MPWIIDRDILHETARTFDPKFKSRVGVLGPHDYKGDGSELTHKFQMLDDDEELIYEGRSHEEHSFDPLDDFGMPDAGCTIIRYLVDGKWVVT